MAASSQVSQNKRRRDEYLNSGLASPDAKRTDIGTLGHDGDIMAFLEKIDNMDNNEDTVAVNEVEGEMMLNGVIKSLGDEIGLKEQTNYDDESTDEKGSTTDQMGSNKQGELTADGYSEAITSDIRDFTYYEDFRAEHDFFLDNITLYEFGILMENYLDGDSVPDIMYSDAVHGYVESREVSYGSLWEDDIWQFNEHYGSLWEDDIWQFNEHPVIRNDFVSPQQEEFGISEAEFHDVCN